MSIAIRRWWHAPLDVEGLAISAVSAAADAAAAVVRARGSSTAIDTSSELIRSAFETVEHARIDGRGFSPWAELSGFIRCADGSVRLHGNYPHHAEAIRRAVGITSRRELDEVAAQMPAQEFEDAVLAAGGVAARVRTAEEWQEHDQGRLMRDAPWTEVVPTGERALPGSDDAPLAGVRVLDLTRVLAGPTCTQLLACLGADVLRIDPPGRPEILEQHLLTGMGKRSTELDLADHRSEIAALLSDADVVVLGYRPGSLDRFGLAATTLAAEHPRLVIASLSAWGHEGPWGHRPGFDSIVQAATGIAVRCAGPDGRPGALPVQALDFATGYVLAARILELLAAGRGGTVSASLVGAAQTLLALPSPPEVDDEVSMGTTMVTVSSPHGTLFLPPPPLLLARRSLERDVGGYGAAAPAWH
ncbi:CoA transferase [Microbacterium oryzae]|uniref:CoA transferase n=1 Tax=Microbacterium oryzae TaxID=743009 RepID=A0A6I6DYF2_9MICO|nr:CoA transferase [Microbacterium oryzae]QGU27004.1 CoA transferase [Microbacterium oryzae]